ncbi:hypothetical protein DUNSADRAFT_5236 [Dunaliella salina]|uniref:BAR domain-containing protein n=1 Tax=Dunaliella salina TaxID=3046 RepID=A0ABQ7GQM2_DUNSA|nr:hypothetical protein DUNSADRAFT_5236 [Dunaliella salina]|eukprot:KAF5836905.1 hypothetical protein DUNSADRAFT_5236 [Dunaliella salina]
MPSSFARFGEKMRQTLNIDMGTPKDWKPTSNTRVVANMAEVRSFAQHVKRLLRDWGAMEKWTDASLSSMRSVLASRLPHVLDFREGQSILQPMSPTDRTVGGGDLETEAIADAAQQMQRDMNSQVLLPLQQWLSAYRSIKAKIDSLEEQRLDLDTKRREVLTLQEKHNKADPKDIPATLDKKTAAEAKLDRLQRNFKEAEAEVFAALTMLINDTVIIKDYHSQCLEIMENTFSRARTVFRGQAQAASAPPQTAEQPSAPTWYAEAKANADAHATGSEHAYESDN